jgi:hypothetical protein
MSENIIEEGEAGLEKDEKTLLAIVLTVSAITHWLFFFSVFGFW